MAVVAGAVLAVACGHASKPAPEPRRAPARPKQLSIADSARRCRAGNANECRYLGSVYANGFGVMADRVRAREFYAAGCRLGDATSCRAIGETPPRQRPRYARPDRRSLDEFRRSCLRGEAQACAWVGATYEHGWDGTPRDAGLAVRYYGYGCGLRDRRACGNANGVREKLLAREAQPPEPVRSGITSAEEEQLKQLAVGTRRARATEPDSEERRESYWLECRRGEAASCIELGVMRANGRGGPKDPEGAFNVLDLACDRDFSSCMDIALSYESGDFGKRDRKRGEWFRKRALRSEGRFGCRYGAADKCVTYAYGFLAGDHVEREPRYALVLFEEACRDGDARGCAGAAELHLRDAVPGASADAGVKLYRQACLGGDGTACWELGRLHLRGEHVTQDLRRARKLFVDACAYGSQPACDYLDDEPR